MKRIAVVLLSAAFLSACQTSSGGSASQVAPGGASGSPTPQLVATPLRCPAKDTIIRTSTGNTLEFKGADGAVCRFDLNGASSKNILGFWSTEHRSAADATAALQQLDLQVGKEVSFQTNGSSNAPSLTWTNVYSVLRTESVSVPAGTFDAFIIKWNQTGKGYEHDVYLWYVPAIGYTVKQKVDLLRGNGNSLRNWEATTVTLPKV